MTNPSYFYGFFSALNRMTARVIAAKHSLDIHKSLDLECKQSHLTSKAVQMLMPSKDLSKKVVGALAQRIV